MSERIYQEIVAHLREGRPEDQIDACGCMGCPQNPFGGGDCPCGERCKCNCTLPDQIRKNAERAREMEFMTLRAKHQLVMEHNLKLLSTAVVYFENHPWAMARPPHIMEACGLAADVLACKSASGV